MKLTLFIEHIIHRHLNEQSANKISELVIEVGNEFKAKYKKSFQELNAGYCEDIADEILDRLGINHPDIIIMDDGWFWNLKKVSIYQTLSGEYWNVKNLKKYGIPPFGYDNLNKLDLIGHSWIYSHGKHYDIEASHGVDNFWDLPIYQRQLSKLKL